MTEWPALTVEERAWEPAVALEHLTRRQRALMRPTYEAAVPCRIAGLAWQPSPTLAADLDDITAQVARFDEASPIELGPMAGLLLRSEAAASSRIERLTASARAILSAEVGDLSRPNAVEITQNTAALTEAVGLAHEPDAESLLAMHRALLTGVDSHAGQWRGQQVWIGGLDHGPFGADFVPPHHERVPALIDDLVAFMQRDDLPVLAHAALAHAQFETIHPFTDGNGRTGRALLHALLRTKGLTRRVTVPVSAGLLVDTGAYFASLDAYRAGAPDVIVERVAGAAVRGVQQARLLVDELVEAHAGWVEAVQARAGSSAWRLLELLRGRPVVTAAVIESELGLAAPNVRRAVAPLVEAGVLVESRMPLDGRRLVWRAPAALAALDRFAERSGRRSLV